MDLFFCADASERELRSELTHAFPGATLSWPHPSLLQTDADLARPLPHLAFARQWLPNARSITAESIRDWANLILSSIAGTLPDDQPWSLHVEPHYGAAPVRRMGARAWHTATRKQQLDRTHLASPPSGTPDAEAGRHRCRLIREALREMLRKRRRHLLRQLRPDPVSFTPADSLVQVILTAPGSGFLSVTPAPVPFDHCHLVSPFPKGAIPVASDDKAPSRAFAKLLEAELRLGRAIRANETCVDLGAAPGSWTYLANNRGARVIAVDHAPLRADLMSMPNVRFHPGDAFEFEVRQPVDWLLCDVIAPPERSAGLLLHWLREGWCRHFVVTVKLKDSSGLEVLLRLKSELPRLARVWFLTRLCANKKEVCAFGYCGRGGSSSAG